MELLFIAAIVYSRDAVTEQVADSIALRPSWTSGAILRNREGLFVATFFSRIVILSRAATSQSKQQESFHHKDARVRSVRNISCARTLYSASAAPRRCMSELFFTTETPRFTERSFTS